MFAEAVSLVNDAARLDKCEAGADEEADVHYAVGEREGHCDVEQGAGEDEQRPKE